MAFNNALRDTFNESAEGTVYTEKFYVDTSASVETRIDVDPNKPNNSAHANKYLAVTLSTDRTIKLVSAGDKVLGRLENVEQDGLCLVAVRGDRIRFTASDAIAVDAKIVGAGSGTVAGNNATNYGRVAAFASGATGSQTAATVNAAITAALKARGTVTKKADAAGDIVTVALTD